MIKKILILFFVLINTAQASNLLSVDGLQFTEKHLQLKPSLKTEQGKILLKYYNNPEMKGLSQLDKNIYALSYHIGNSLYKKYVPEKLTKVSKAEKQYLENSKCYTELDEVSKKYMMLGFRIFKENQYIYNHFNGTNYRKFIILFSAYTIDGNQNLYNQAIKDKFIVINNPELSKKVLEKLHFHPNASDLPLIKGFPKNPVCGKIDPM